MAWLMGIVSVFFSLQFDTQEQKVVFYSSKAKSEWGMIVIVCSFLSHPKLRPQRTVLRFRILNAPVVRVGTNSTRRNSVLTLHTQSQTVSSQSITPLVQSTSVRCVKMGITPKTGCVNVIHCSTLTTSQPRFDRVFDVRFRVGFRCV